MTPVCPFAKAARPDDGSVKKNNGSPCKYAAEHERKDKNESGDSGKIEAKCPFGYDSQTFKLGPLSCMICQALLFETSKCVPCSHVFCNRAAGDAGSAVKYFEESVEFLSRSKAEDMEITHTLSVSLNKIGDLKYYDGDLQAARSYYFRSLDVRRAAMKSDCHSPSLALDVAVSLAKVADADRGLGNEEGANAGFREAIDLLQSLKISANDVAIDQRRQSVLEFLNSQIAEKQRAN